MSLIETILKLAVQLLVFFVTLAFRIVSGIVGALWSAFQNRAPRPAYQSPLARAFQHKKYHRRRRKRWRRR